MRQTARKTMKGRFIPSNPSKYIGNVNKIIFRSSWELHFFKWLDANDSVLKYGSEELSIPYISPLDGRVHRYFPDLIILYKHKDGSIRKEIIEIKPFKETVPTPKMSERDKQVLAVNMAKWQAAGEFANMYGATFRVVTEKTLWSGTSKRKAPEIGRSV